jgi:hypothetical protein
MLTSDNDHFFKVISEFKLDERRVQNWTSWESELSDVCSAPRMPISEFGGLFTLYSLRQVRILEYVLAHLCVIQYLQLYSSSSRTSYVISNVKFELKTQLVFR